MKLFDLFRKKATPVVVEPVVVSRIYRADYESLPRALRVGQPMALRCYNSNEIVIETETRQHTAPVGKALFMFVYNNSSLLTNVHVNVDILLSWCSRVETDTDFDAAFEGVFLSTIKLHAAREWRKKRLDRVRVKEAVNV